MYGNCPVSQSITWLQKHFAYTGDEGLLSETNKGSKKEPLLGNLYTNLRTKFWVVHAIHF